MPAGKRPQNNTMLYTLITFVGLFIITTTIAIIYYVKSESHRTNAATLQNQLDDLATSAELRQTGKIIGAKQSRKSRLGTMIDYLDGTVSLIIGGLPEDTSAEVKVDTANRKNKDILDLLAKDYPDIGTDTSNSIGLTGIIEKLKTKLDNTTNAETAMNEQFEQLQNRFDDAMAASLEKEQTLLAEKEKFQQQTNDIQQDYEELKTLMNQTSEQQVLTLRTQLEEERNAHKELNQKLLKTQAELNRAQEKIKLTQDMLQAIVPPPDTEVAVFKPDGKIILIDDPTKIVHLNIGTDDHVYRGLTFAVYDKNMPIPKDGKGKAEIEVFNAGKSISAARITLSEKKNPIILDDIIANLIWDSDRTNTLAVAGDFDLDGDGVTDYNGAEKIKALIEKWGGKVSDSVSIDTDFLALGSAPKIRRKPTFEEMEVDPMAMEEYESSLQKLAHYQEFQNRAKALSIPVFNTERFLYFIGYKSQSDRPGAFR